MIKISTYIATEIHQIGCVIETDIGLHGFKKKYSDQILSDIKGLFLYTEALLTNTLPRYFISPYVV